MDLMRWRSDFLVQHSESKLGKKLRNFFIYELCMRCEKSRNAERSTEEAGDRWLSLNVKWETVHVCQRNPRTQTGDSLKTRHDDFVLSLSVIIGKWERHLSSLWQPWGCTKAIELPQGSSPDVNQTPVTIGTPSDQEQSAELFTDGGASQFSFVLKRNPIWHKDFGLFV